MIDLRLGDALAVMATLDDASVDAVITDPPYGMTDQEWDIAPDLPEFWREAKRVARPHAAFVIFACQPFATDLVCSNRKAFRYDLVWAKKQAVGFLDANRKPLRSHELILVFGSGLKFNRIDWPRETKNLRSGATMNAVAPSGKLYGKMKGRRTYTYTDMECPKSVLHFARPGNFHLRSRPDYHPNAKPFALMRWLVESYSPPGGLVLDPYMGSGTTGLACLETGRAFLGIENDPDYFAKAERRLAQATSPAAI